LQTIQEAATKTKPGSVVFVDAGIYKQPLNINISGTSSAPITYQTNGKVITEGFTINASYVTINGFEITDNLLGDSSHGIQITGSYDNIENNYIHDLQWGGIILYATVSNPTQSAHNIIQKNKISHVGQVGIDIRGRDNTVQYNDISATMQYVPAVSNPPSWVDADGIYFHGQGHIFRGNYIHDISYTQPENRDPHIDCFQTFAAPPSQEAASNILFDGNYCNEPTSNADRGLAAKFTQSENAQNLIFINNVVYAYLAGIVQQSTNISFLNNTFVAPVTANEGQGLYLSKDTNITIENNIFANQTNGVGAIFPDSASNSSLVAGYNCIWNQGSKRTSKGDVVGKNPLFVNPVSNFHFQAGSPCIDQGLTLPQVTHDFDGAPRPQGKGYDMGAYEFAVPP